MTLIPKSYFSATDVYLPPVGHVSGVTETSRIYRMGHTCLEHAHIPRHGTAEHAPLFHVGGIGNIGDPVSHGWSPDFSLAMSQHTNMIASSSVPSMIPYQISHLTHQTKVWTPATDKNVHPVLTQYDVRFRRSRLRRDRQIPRMPNATPVALHETSPPMRTFPITPLRFTFYNPRYAHAGGCGIWHAWEVPLTSET